MDLDRTFTPGAIRNLTYDSEATTSRPEKLSTLAAVPVFVRRWVC
jgi:hypothetical protein